MFVVLDEELEKRVIQAVKGRRTLAGKPLLELSAILEADEELVAVGPGTTTGPSQFRRGAHTLLRGEALQGR